MWWPLTDDNSEDGNMTNSNGTSCGNSTQMTNSTQLQNNETYPLCINSTEIFSNVTEEQDVVGNNLNNTSKNNTLAYVTETTSNAKEQDDEEDSLERRFFYMYYTTADETQFTTDRLIDVATFIASVGGTLGLYLGFSFLGLLFPLYDYAEASYTKWRRKSKRRSN